MSPRELPIPPHFRPERTGEVWKVDYRARAAEAREWARRHEVPPSASDRARVCLVAVDVQNTFCTPGFELFVGGRSGTGAVDDNRRLCEFVYRNLSRITRIFPTMDTHRAFQIFHEPFLLDGNGEHPAPFTRVSLEDLERGIWNFNPALASELGITPEYGRRILQHYVETLRRGGKYDLTVWPYHAMLGGIGHALVASFEEAVFFHGIARICQPGFHVKGDRPLTEHYSVLGAEVTEGPHGEILGPRGGELFDRFLSFDAILVAGQAKSHCVAWTVRDLLEEIQARDPSLAGRVYLLEDCTSPVVIPGAIDYTDAADEAFRRFAEAGMHRVRSTDPVADWPGFPG